MLECGVACKNHHALQNAKQISNKVALGPLVNVIIIIKIIIIIIVIVLIILEPPLTPLLILRQFGNIELVSFRRSLKHCSLLIAYCLKTSNGEWGQQHCNIQEGRGTFAHSAYRQQSLVGDKTMFQSITCSQAKTRMWTMRESLNQVEIVCKISHAVCQPERSIVLWVSWLISMSKLQRNISHLIILIWFFLLWMQRATNKHTKPWPLAPDQTKFVVVVQQTG